MQQVLDRFFTRNEMFQSSPVPEDGCNVHCGTIHTVISRFQSSPVPEDGCNGRWTRAMRPSQGFNPHPSRRTGATR